MVRNYGYICTIIIVIIFKTGLLYASNINQVKLDDIKLLIYTNTDSAISILNELEMEAIDTDNTELIIKTLFLKSDALRVKQDYITAYDISKEAYKIATVLSDTMTLIKANSHLGIISYVVFKEEDSWNHLNKALELTKTRQIQSKVNQYLLMNNYLGIVQHLKRFQKYHQAFYYLDSCYMIAEKYSLDELNIAYFDVNKAFLLLKTNAPEQALEYLKSSEYFFENIDSNKYRQDHRPFLPTVYSYIAEALRLTGNLELSEEYFIKSLDELEKYKSQHNHKPYVLEQYAWLLYETGNYEKAIRYLNESKQLSEGYFVAKSLNDSSFQKVKNRYQSELNTRMQELIISSMELAQKDKAIMRFRIFTFAIITLILISLLMFRIKRTAKRHKAEKNRIIEKEKQAKELVKLKNRELTQSTLQLIEKDEIITQLYNELQKPSTKKNDALLKQIKNSSDNLWDDFNSRFMSVNQDFYRKLSAKFPDLSANDLKICALIKLNFSSKEMAHLLGISIDSVQKARYRLRKKLNMDRNTNLTSYISAI